MISTNIKNAFREAIKGDQVAEGKWQRVGTTIKTEYSDRASVEAIKQQFLDDVIYPAMGDNAVAAVNADLPRMNSTEYKERAAKTDGYAAQWKAANTLKKNTKAAGHEYFTRSLNYAFGAQPKGDTTPRTLKTRTVEELTALIKAHEKDEMNGDAQVIAALSRALDAAVKMK
jgi:hypothetical protein